jgi:hypothetical protein
MKYALTATLIGLAATMPLVERRGMSFILDSDNSSLIEVDVLEAREAKLGEGLGLLALGPLGALLEGEINGNTGLAALLDPLGLFSGNTKQGTGTTGTNQQGAQGTAGATPATTNGGNGVGLTGAGNTGNTGAQVPAGGTPTGQGIQASLLPTPKGAKNGTRTGKGKGKGKGKGILNAALH